ncbi:MAG TPA: FGGY family carbohydrate kinase, partial [Anaerolinea sp.]|nr:FGGY family carbohydrate kinase [Anaerolinea sp.]
MKSEGKYAIGVDFGTESGRAVLVDVTNGAEVATAVYPYANGVIDQVLPGTEIRLEPDWALQDPNDYIETFRQAVPTVLRQSGVDPAGVIGIGIDFTACTLLPTLNDGTPLCFLPQYRDRPHAWVKLWKHHAAQPEANALNEIARRMDCDFLDRYGGKVSSEWFFPKVWQILNEDEEIYTAAGRFIEAADWVVWQLTGNEKRSACAAGYKALWSKSRGYPPDAFFKALDPRMEHIVDEKMTRTLYTLGQRAGGLTAQDEDVLEYKDG